MSASTIIKKGKINRHDLIAYLALDLGLPKVKVDQVLRRLFDQIQEKTMDGNQIVLPGFGSFFLRASGGFERGGKYIRRSHRICFVPSRSTRQVIPDAEV